MYNAYGAFGYFRDNTIQTIHYIICWLYILYIAVWDFTTPGQEAKLFSTNTCAEVKNTYNYKLVVSRLLQVQKALIFYNSNVTLNQKARSRRRAHDIHSRTIQGLAIIDSSVH